MRAAILILAVSVLAAQSAFTPTPLSSLAIPGYANNVDVSGNYAYVAAGATGLQVVNVANPSAPVIVAARDTPGNANDVRVVGPLAYIADGAGGLRIIDVSNPSSPVTLGALDTAGEADDVAVSGSLAFVADGPDGVKIIDVSNPAAPSLVGSVSVPGIARGVDVEGTTLVVAADLASRLIVIDVADPGAASIVGSVFLPGSLKDVDLAGNYAYVAAFTGGVWVIDVSDPAAPVAVGNLPGSAPVGFVPRDVEVVGSVAVFAEQLYVNAVPIVDVSNPAAPVIHGLLNAAPLGDYAGTGIAVRGPYVFWTAEAFVVGPENGVTGNTRLFIGQYLAFTSTAMESAPNPSIEGAEVTLTATVAAPPFSPTGDVEFFDDADSLGIATLVDGSATLAVSSLSAGSHTLTARYLGDATYASSVSSPVTQDVNAGTFALGVLIAGAGSGTVTSDDSLITCPDECSATYDSGSTPTLTATAGAGSAFTGWSGDCTGTDPCALAIDGDKSVTATFATSGRDLLVTAVSDPVPLAAAGSAYAVTDTTTNQGAVLAGGSTTRYYLSLDGVKGAGDVRLTGSRAVPSLDTGISSSDSTIVTIPTSVAPGIYRQLACADDLTAVAESSELNNCLASDGTIQIVRPDLVVTAVSDPPATIAPGGKFTVTDTVQNSGVVAAGASSTRYYLSVDTGKDGSDVLFSGSRSVPMLAEGEDSTGSKSVTVPAGMPPGTYRLLACADDQKKVAESNEGNNCAASAAAVVVGWPDLVTTVVSNPPAGAVRGGTFTMTDTVLNQGTAPAAKSSTQYYLSLDGLRDPGDIVLTGKRAVVSLVPGAASSGSKTVTVPLAAPFGTYIVLACADGLDKVIESDNANNCRASSTKVTIHP